MEVSRLLLPVLSPGWPLAIPGTVSHLAPLSMGTLQARTLEWVAMSSCRGSSRPRDGTCEANTAGGFFATGPPGTPPCKQTAHRAFCGAQRRMWASWASLEGKGGTRRPRALEKQPSLQFRLRPPLQLHTKPLSVGGSEGGWWYPCGSVSQPLPTEQAARLLEMLIIC